MATLWVTEYAEMPVSQKGADVPIGMEPAVTSQTVSFTATSGGSNAFNTKTRYVRLISSDDCHIKFGVSPTAATTDAKMMAGAPEYFGIANVNGTLSVAARTA